MDLLPPYAPLLQGGKPTLFDVIASVSCVVTNTGNFPVGAAEVAQLYIGIPNGLPKQLRGFSKQSMDAGKSVVMEFDLTRRDLSTWDVVQQEWVLQRGEYAVYVGASVLDIRLEGSLIIK
jgi:beta-glucosidase